jgi:hypothetical protein
MRDVLDSSIILSAEFHTSPVAKIIPINTGKESTPL